MFRKIAIMMLGPAMMLAATACNDDSGAKDPILPGSCQVTSFALSADTMVCANLDTVFFSIDQLKGEIFNADSLPKGSKITRLVPRITVATASIAELYVPRGNGLPDSVHNYLLNPKDSIDFSHGPVRLRLVSIDGQSTCDYKIRVNVHKENPDTLVWSRLERAGLPSAFQVINAQATAHTADKFYCLTTYDGKYCMASATDPSGTWTYNVLNGFGFTPVISSLSATENALYILDENNNLMTSTDGGKSWTATGQRWNYIYGSHGDQLLGCALNSGVWQTVSYPQGSPAAMPAQFPVSGTSQTVTYSFEMSALSQTIIVGGRLADGTISDATWSYDGNSWLRISKTPLPYALEGATVVPYFTVNLNKTTWTATRRSMLVAMFGKRSDGHFNDTVYMSPDMGMHWEKATPLLAAAAKIPARTNADGFVYKQMLRDTPAKARGISNRRRWVDIPLDNRNTDASALLTPAVTATSPITEWECPYIYLFGGLDAQGSTYNALYRGVITRFTFKPLQ